MKRLLSLLFCLVLCTSLLPVGFAEDIEIMDEPEDELITIVDPGSEPISVIEPGDEPERPAPGVGTDGTVASGECGDSLSWTLNDAGRLSVSGSGAMWDFSMLDAPWDDYRIDISSVVIGDSVTSIGNWAFGYCGNLTSVTIGSRVKSIGEWTFAGCYGLTAVSVPSGVTSIGSHAFYDSGLTGVTIPAGVTSIGTSAFLGCGSLSAIQVDAGNQNYKSQDGVLLTKNGSTLLCFPGKKSGAYTVPNGVKSISEEAFRFCSGLTGVALPTGLSRIGESAFSSCYSLTEIMFQGTAPRIGDYCFDGVTAAAWYPAGDASWTDSVRKDYTGKISWAPYKAVTLGGDSTSATLPVHDSLKFFAKSGGTMTNASWSVSDTKVASVNQNGLVTAKKYGKCTVTAKASDGRSASCELQTLFWDVADPGQYYFKHVYWAAENGITKGYNLEYFAPQEACKREQMMVFLWRLAGEPEPETTESPFPDVTEDAYYFRAVLWGVEKGITKGYTTGQYAGCFGVGLACTREQAATFLWRMAGEPEPETEGVPFKDVSASAYYYKAVLWAAENEIAKGYSSGEYAGKYGVGLSCLREHTVTFLSRYADRFMTEPEPET